MQLMAGVLIHDGRRIAHRKWATDAISAGFADGVVLTPFSTPRVSVPRHPSAQQVASAVTDVGGEVIFDAMTHARFLAGVNRTDFYDDWELWGTNAVDVSSPQQRLAHVERVFECQDLVGSPHLAPTLSLQSPLTQDATFARDLARTARGIDSGAWQSLAGTRAFWASGVNLDAYVGTLVALRAPVWIVTVNNEIVVDHVPDMTDVLAFAGLCRTVHSLSLRSRVIVSHADYAGLPAVAAGADTVGSGWDRGQRTFDPNSFRVDSDPGIRIPASYVTQGNLHALLRRDTAEAIERWDSAAALAIRGGPMPASDQVQRMHHLNQLRAAVLAINAAGSRADRVAALRMRYQAASADFDILNDALPRTVQDRDKYAWATAPANVLETYAQPEGF
ncbi:hypothetical protein [Mycobacterium sp. NPDC050041]|uniref:hypothetical protein n=1 Tax=Mycobacterium sp. NPDC050041 TaxID=3364293 RepID=UPI003C2CD511